MAFQVPVPRIQAVDQSTEWIVFHNAVADAQIDLFANGTPVAQLAASEVGLDWALAGNTSNFGDVTSDGRPFWTGNFGGSGRDGILFFFPGDGNWWLGAVTDGRLSWTNVANTTDLGNLGDGRPVWTGNFSRPDQTDLLSYSPADHTWSIGQFTSSGSSLSWSQVGDTSNFGDLADGRPFWVGGFSGSGRDEILFYFPGDGNWWLGSLSNGQLSWANTGNSADLPNLAVGGPFWTGEFSRPDHTDIVFYSPADQNWFLAQFSGASMAWNQVANTSNLGDIVTGRPFFTGKFSRPERTDLLAYSPPDQNWLLGTFADTQLRWQQVGNTSGFGDVADGRPFWVGQFSGRARDDILFYFPGDSNWWLGNFAELTLRWTQAANTRGLGDFTNGRRTWTGRFGSAVVTSLLTYSSSDSNWRLGQLETARMPAPRQFSPGEVLTASQTVDGAMSDASAPQIVRHTYATQGYDFRRSGWNPRETTLTVASVKAGLRQLFTHPVDGQIYAQPLYVPNLQMGDGNRHNVVFVATEADSVYAFDADGAIGAASAPLWHVQLLPSGESPVQGKADLDGCDNVDPQVGITATPVVDVATDTLFVVTKSKSNGDYHCRIHALDLTSGDERANSPLDIQHEAFDPHWENNRTALLLKSNTLYVAFGAHCDRGPYHGWVLAYHARFLSPLAAFNTSPNSGTPDTGFSGVWQCGVGLSSDEDGNILFTTGNGVFTASDGGVDYGNTVLKLSPDLRVLDYFTPFNQQYLNNNDWDLGSGGVVVLPEQQPGAPHPRLAIACGKQGLIYLLDRAGQMGKYNGPNGPDHVLNTIALYPGRVPTGPGRPSGSDADTPGVYGAPAYYMGQDGPRLYFCGSNGPIKAFVVQNDALTPQGRPGGDINQSSDPYMGQRDEHGVATSAGGCTPVISSDLDRPGTAIVWAVTRHGPQILRAYDADDLTAVLFEAEAGTWNNAHGAPFTVPTVVEGKVYVGTADRLAVFGL